MKRVALIDVDSFATAVDKAVKEQIEKGAEQDNLNLAIFDAAIGHAIHRLAKIILENSVIEDWN